MTIVRIDNETLGLQESYYYKDFIKTELTGAKWIKDTKMWQIEFSIGNIEKLKSVRCEIPIEIENLYEEKKKIINQVTQEKISVETEAIEEMPIKAKPYQHQVKAFNIACKLMNLFKEGDAE